MLAAGRLRADPGSGCFGPVGPDRPARRSAVD